MLIRSLFGIFCLVSLSWPGNSALETITSSAELAAVEQSTKVHALLVFGTKGEAQERRLEELATTAYPALLDLEKDLEGIITFGVVDIAPHHKDSIGNKWQLTKLPALVLYKDPPKENPYTNKLYRDATIVDIAMFENPRKLEKMLKKAIPMEFVKELVGDEATLMSFEKLVQEKADEGDAVALLISKQKHASPMYRALAAEFDDQGLSFMFLHNGEEGAEEIMKTLKAEDLPAMMVLKSMTEYVLLRTENSKTYTELKGFVEPFATQKRSGDTIGMSKDKKGKDSSNYIRFFTEKDFDDLVMLSDVIWIIEFMDLARERTLIEEEWKKTLTELHRKAGVVAIGAVSCTKDTKLCERYGFGARIFPLGLTDDKKVKRDAVLPQTFPTIEEAKETAIATIPDLTVAIASASDLNAFISHAQEHHALPILLFASKKHTPPLIKALLLSVPTQKLMLAVVHNADEDLKSQFRVKSSTSTSLVCLVPTQANLENPASVPFGVVAYEKKRMGAFTYPNIMQFILQVLAQYPHPQESGSQSDDVDFSSLDEASAPLLVPHATKNNVNDLCGGNKICAIGFFEDHVDTLRDPESRLTKWWTTFAHVAFQSKQNREPFHFMWVNGKCQKDFAEAFGVGLFQMPTLAVYSPSKQRYATSVGIFDEENAAAFLKSVLSGSISTAPIGDVPELGEECSFEEIQDAAVGVDDTVEDDEELDSMLSEILSDEKKQRDEMEKEFASELKQAEKGKKKYKSKKKSKKHKTKKKSKKRKAARDEL